MGEDGGSGGWVVVVVGIVDKVVGDVNDSWSGLW